MRNPWIDLPECPPFILPADFQLVGWLNENCPPNQQIITDSLPEPWVGDPRRAKVLLLGLNPGHKPDKEGKLGDSAFFGRPEVPALIVRNLFHAVPDLYHLRPEYRRYPGARWWRRALKQLIADCGIEAVQFSVSAIELFPYHSRSFAYRGRLASVVQPYMRELVLEAVRADKVIVVLWAIDSWTCAVPELAHYNKALRLQLNKGFPMVRVMPETCAFGVKPWSPGPSREAYEMLVSTIRGS